MCVNKKSIAIKLFKVIKEMFNDESEIDIEDESDTDPSWES